MPRSIITFAFFLTALGLGFGLVLPKYQLIRSIQEEINNKKIDLQNRTDYFEQIKTISAQLEEYNEELLKISDALPSRLSLPSLFDFFHKTVSQTGLVLENISLNSIKFWEAEKRTEVDEEKVEIKDALVGTKEIYLNLKLAGSYSSFKDFLSALEKSVRIIAVKQISFSSPTKSEDSPSFELKVKTQSY